VSENYTPDEIVWRETAIVYDQVVSYIAQLGFESGYGGMMNLGADLQDGGWYATVEAHRKFRYGPSKTADEAKRDAVNFAKRIIVEMIAELQALEKNTKPKQIARKSKSIK
jgi:predicted transcriptional regulator